MSAPYFNKIFIILELPFFIAKCNELNIYLQFIFCQVLIYIALGLAAFFNKYFTNL